ncbi:MAG TPA: bacillithiol biosynthesis cysteine-adding enzyme BshC [Acidobacteriaceae bacterium]|nr:bacillithiol biosynthesis cysteine-adding enzyme BshC [Acidobacteriaceae bacterium]
MSTECYPITMLPNVTRLYRDYVAMGDASASPVRTWYGAQPLSQDWTRPAAASAHPAALADALEQQSREFGASGAMLANIAKLRAGARAIVTGQQVGLLGGPLLTLHKAATAVARARQATAASGVEHVPVFWLASEDHDIEEVNQAALLTKNTVETLRLGVKPATETPVGDVALGEAMGPVLERASELLSYAPVTELLQECYGASGATFASAFARLMTRLFADHGLIVMDAAGRDFHALGASALRAAIEQAEELEAALLARTNELESAGYHAQVLVKPGASLLFLVSEVDGAKTRQPLKRLPDGTWKAGNGSGAKSLTTAELLAILEESPERLSPNALLRPVFQDTILPTTAYIGGPAEVAYFAQSAVLYERVLQRVTPILPRMSATVLEPAIAAVMAQQEVSLPDAMTTPDELAQRLGARAMPIEAKRRLAAAGNALDEALTAAQSYMGSLDTGLGQAAEVSASKMRYQMDRLRRLAATYELNKEQSLKKHADAMALHLFPEGHPQERVIAGAWFVAAWQAAKGDAGAGLIDLLVETAASQCPGHLVVRF